MLESFSEAEKITTRIQKLIIFSLSAALLACLVSVASAQSVYEPARGSAERKAILDTIRPLVEVRVGPPVEFVVGWMRSGNGWAFARVDPQRPGGGAIDLRFTSYANQAEFMDDLTTYALLVYRYNRWNLVDFVVGPTDVFWVGDPLYAQLPPGLTPY
ncbi:hypothetical protein ABLO27_15510 [Roseibium sp. SCPC15]|uniref:hypothetical protein n=1 Tax=Roseibium sp. SCP15 TaxID=3141376 RepID=UPI003334E5B3